MRVLLTGGLGRIGRATAERLLQHGYEVRLLDQQPDINTMAPNAQGFAPGKLDGAQYAQCDILDYDAVREHMRGCDRVIHLAALAGPILAPGQRVFDVNVTGTFNVFEAAAACGIKRVVQASSINAIGAFYSMGEVERLYLPLDEAHPSFTTDPYSFSKEVIEEIGAYYWRRDGISSVAARFPGVRPIGDMQSNATRERNALAHKALNEFIRQPAAQQQKRLDAMRQQNLDYRRLRPFEYREGEKPPPRPDFAADPLFAIYAFSRYDLWTWIDVRDAAQSLEKALTAEYDGAHPLFVTDAHNWLGYDSRTLARLFFPNARISDDLRGTSTLVSIERARHLIGYAPEHSVAQA
jgi:nucleoside-diphosphate-sugar epimerase